MRPMLALRGLGKLLGMRKAADEGANWEVEVIRKKGKDGEREEDGKEKRQLRLRRERLG